MTTTKVYTARHAETTASAPRTDKLGQPIDTTHRTTRFMTAKMQAAFMWLTHSTLAASTRLDHGYDSPQVLWHADRARHWQLCHEMYEATYVRVKPAGDEPAK